MPICNHRDFTILSAPDEILFIISEPIPLTADAQRRRPQGVVAHLGHLPCSDRSPSQPTQIASNLHRAVCPCMHGPRSRCCQHQRCRKVKNLLPQLSRASSVSFIRSWCAVHKQCPHPVPREVTSENLPQVNYEILPSKLTKVNNWSLVRHNNVSVVP